MFEFLKIMALSAVITASAVAIVGCGDCASCMGGTGSAPTTEQTATPTVVAPAASAPAVVAPDSPAPAATDDTAATATPVE